MALKYDINSKQCLNRKKWQSQHKGEKKTCPECKKTTLVYDPNDLEEGFQVNENTYKGVKKLSTAKTCLSCKSLQRKLQRKAITDEEKKIKETTPGEAWKIGVSNKIKNSWMCRKCDTINSGKKNACRSCGSSTHKWKGVKINHEPKKINTLVKGWKGM